MFAGIGQIIVAIVGNTIIFVSSIFHSGTDFPQQDLENIIYMDIPAGRVVIQLLPEVAPITCRRIKELTRQHYYDGAPFYRVIPGFIAQTGDHTATGRGGTDVNLPAEFSDISHKRGTVSMARGSWVNSADSQFFIVMQDSPHLDRQFTVFGKVVAGIEAVDRLKKGDPRYDGRVYDPDVIYKMRVAADIK